MSLTVSKNFTEPEVFVPFNNFLLAKMISLRYYYFITIALLSLSLSYTLTKSIEGNIENAQFSLLYYKTPFAAARGGGVYN